MPARVVTVMQIQPLISSFSIIFVHGLGGDAFQTWTVENNHMWPKDFVPQILPKARVMTFGYDSKWAFSPSTADINDFARDLLHRLRSKRWSAKVGIITFFPSSLNGKISKRPCKIRLCSFAIALVVLSAKK